MTMPASTAKSTSGSGFVISVRPMPACATNSDSTQKIMNTFHSSGTPIGMALRMPRWKQTMTKAAMAVGQPPWEKSSANGTSISIAVLMCATNRDSHPGRRSSGNLSKNIRLSARGRTTGLLDIIVETTNGKCLVSFEVAAPIQITTQTSLAATTMFSPPSRNATVKLPYTSPRAARKITLSRRPASASRPRMAQICHIGSRPTVVPSAGTGPVPSENNATTSITSSAAYSTTSTGVRLSPLVSGTRLGHGGSRIVLGRNQYRIEPIGGKNRLFSGPNPQPNPTTSKSIV